jgi:hypothetical protein
MRKKPSKPADDDLRPEYDLSRLRGGVRGKYYRRAKAGTNLVLIEPEIARAFPGDRSVNQALKLLLDAAKASTRPARRTRARPARRAG